MQVKDINTREEVVQWFAIELADLQKRADNWYYVHNNQEMSSFVLDLAYEIKTLTTKLGICKPVYEEAYKIYDFRNSGKSGYTLSDGKIVKIDN